MDLELTRNDYIEHLNCYIKRDKKLLNGYFQALKKATNTEYILFLTEIQKIADNLMQNLHILETTNVHKTGVTFFIDGESGHPTRFYNVDDAKIVKKAQERAAKKQDYNVDEFKKMFG